MATGSVRARRRRHDEAAAWLLRRREGVPGPEDERAFQDWLERDPENRRVFEAAERLMGEARTAIETDPTLSDIEPMPRKRPAKVLLPLLLAAGLGAFFVADGPMRLRADALSGPGDMPVLTLDDGSRVQMNASSAIAYDMALGWRTVRLLRGQAYFEVAKDATRPFSVEAGGVRVTALGTEFDVRLGAETTEVTVTEHSVLVEDGGASARVEAGSRAVSTPDGTIRIASAGQDGTLDLSWRRGLLVVDDAPLSRVVEELGRNYSGTILVSPSLEGRRVSGTLRIADTEAALAFLERALGIEVSRLGPLILLRD